MKVRVYRNLHKSCYSVKAMEGENKNRVIYHASEVLLTNVKFVVYESGRQRVLERKQKNVHAFVDGNMASVVPIGADIGSIIEEEINDAKVSYNPYRFGYFYYTTTLDRVDISSRAILNPRGVFIPEYK